MKNYSKSQKFIIWFFIILFICLGTLTIMAIIYTTNPEYLHINIDQYPHLIDKLQHDVFIFLSSGDKGISKSLDRIRDFISLTEENGTGSYPEDYHHKGYKRDNKSIIYSKAPINWGIDELFNFGNYNNISTRAASGIQMANWLEYDLLVNGRSYVSLTGDDTTFNPSGNEWFRQYKLDKNMDERVFNSIGLRQSLRNIK